MSKALIYADNAATTKLNSDALKAMIPFLEGNYGNPSSLYSIGRENKIAVEDARHTIASSIGASDDEIFFTSGGTESNNWAIKGVAYARRALGKHIIVSTIEHHAILHACKSLEKHGFEISYIPVDIDGFVDIAFLRKILRSDTVLVSIMFANNEIGTIQHIKEITSIVNSSNALFHCDAVQAIGHVHIDVTEFGIDLFSASAHKFNGPKGTGFLYKKTGMVIDPFMDGGSQELNQRAGTENVAGIVGMATALKANISMIQANTKHLKKLSNITLDILKRHIPNIRINGSLTSRIPGNVNISLLHADGEGLLHLLDMQSICVSTGSACNSSEKEISHVIKSINVPEDYANGTLRITYGANNTVEEATLIAEKIVQFYKMQISNSPC